MHAAEALAANALVATASASRLRSEGATPATRVAPRNEWDFYAKKDRQSSRAGREVLLPAKSPKRQVRSLLSAAPPAAATRQDLCRNGQPRVSSAAEC